MESRSAQEAVMERIGISLSMGQTAELYQELCNVLLAKDTHAYVNLLRTKYELLQSGVSLCKCDYIIMELLIKKIESESALVVTSVAYLVKYKS